MKIKIITLSTLLATSLYAGTLSINDGWNLKGATEEITQNDLSSSSCIKSVWAYDNLGWKLYHRDISDVTTYGFTTLSTIPVGVGFWAQTDTSQCILEFGAGAATDLQRTLASTIASSSVGMAAAGEAGSGATSGASSAVSTGTSGLARVLYSIIPSFTNDGNGGLSGSMSIPSVTNINATFGMEFNVGGHDVNASSVMDSTGVAYGLGSTDGLPAVGPALGTFFETLSGGGTPDFSTMITSVNRMKASPLFSVVGDATLQDFFNSFPIDYNSAVELDSKGWLTLGTAFQNLALSPTTPPLIDFTKVGFDLNMTFDSTFSMGDMTLSFPSFVASGNLQDIMSDTGTMNMNFVGTGNGTIMMTSMGVSGNISNVEINSTIDSVDGSTISGKYDLSITLADGNTYTGSPTFDQNGCKGADIYDQNGNFVSRMKIFDDGLWIVDQNNLKIEQVQGVQ